MICHVANGQKEFRGRRENLIPDAEGPCRSVFNSGVVPRSNEECTHIAFLTIVLSGKANTKWSISHNMLLIVPLPWNQDCQSDEAALSTTNGAFFIKYGDLVMTVSPLLCTHGPYHDNTKMSHFKGPALCDTNVFPFGEIASEADLASKTQLTIQVVCAHVIQKFNPSDLFVNVLLVSQTWHYFQLLCRTQTTVTPTQTKPQILRIYNLFWLWPNFISWLNPCFKAQSKWCGPCRHFTSAVWTNALSSSVWISHLCCCSGWALQRKIEFSNKKFNFVAGEAFCLSRFPTLCFFSICKYCSLLHACELIYTHHTFPTFISHHLYVITVRNKKCVQCHGIQQKTLHARLLFITGLSATDSLHMEAVHLQAMLWMKGTDGQGQQMDVLCAIVCQSVNLWGEENSSKNGVVFHKKKCHNVFVSLAWKPDD